jgi:hypothetical protein
LAYFFSDSGKRMPGQNSKASSPKIAHLAEAFAMKLEIHHGGNSMNDVANLHIQMAIPNTSFMEVLLPHEA